MDGVSGFDWLVAAVAVAGRGHRVGVGLRDRQPADADPGPAARSRAWPWRRSRSRTSPAPRSATGCCARHTDRRRAGAVRLDQRARQPRRRRGRRLRAARGLAAAAGAAADLRRRRGAGRLDARMRFDGRWAWLAGAASGLFGGLVGNQGGLRAAAMLGFHLPKAVVCGHRHRHRPGRGRRPDAGLRLDRRGPAGRRSRRSSPWPPAAWSFGTLVGHRVLAAVPERLFRVVVALLLLDARRRGDRQRLAAAGLGTRGWG